jgi:carboxyl-terminal processing protease
MSQRNLLMLLLAVVVSYACYVRGEQNPYARYLSDGLAVIDEGALDEAPDRELFRGAMEGMVEVLRQHGDEHSQFVPEGEAEPLRTDIRQQFGGIGVRIGVEGEPPKLVIVGPPEPGTPAAKANLLPGDWIVSIDDVPTDGKGMNELLGMIRGEPGTTVRLTVRQAHQVDLKSERHAEPRAEPLAEPRTVDLVREVINIESILGDRRSDNGGWQFLLEGEPRIAHIRIASFGDRTAADLEEVIETVLDQGAQSIALDLRDNAGGSLDAAVDVCKMFLPAEKVVVETRGRGKSLRQRYATSADGPYLDIPLAVLVNQNSASAAEIVAAALQDHQRAVVVGQQTYGKGTVQQLVPLESGRSLLKLTWANFWRPSGVAIHRAAGAEKPASWGVMPDSEMRRDLSADEYASYRKHRAARDGFETQSATAEPMTGEERPAAEFVDEQLKLAIDHLRKELD